MANYRHNQTQINHIEGLINAFIQSGNGVPLPGIRLRQSRTVLIKQIIDSQRRIDFVEQISKRPISPNRADPNNPIFDPIRASILHKQAGDLDEAFWLVFLLTHFGKHAKSGWRYLQEVYSGLGQTPTWTWDNTKNNPNGFLSWLRSNEAHLLRGTNRGFGPHRSYISMSANNASGTGSAITSYINWVMRHGDHSSLILDAMNKQDPFDYLYTSMDAVSSFGRLAKFDYLTMLSKIGLAPITPQHPYLAGATGPRRGAQLLLQGTVANDTPIKELNSKLVKLGGAINANMQVLEDALCNWQKSPTLYKYFGG